MSASRVVGRLPYPYTFSAVAARSETGAITAHGCVSRRNGIASGMDAVGLRHGDTRRFGRRVWPGWCSWERRPPRRSHRDSHCDSGRVAGGCDGRVQSRGAASYCGADVRMSGASRIRGGDERRQRQVDTRRRGGRSCDPPSVEPDRCGMAGSRPVGGHRVNPPRLHTDGGRVRRGGRGSLGPEGAGARRLASGGARWICNDSRRRGRVPAAAPISADQQLTSDDQREGRNAAHDVK